MGAKNIVVQFFNQFDAMQGNFSPERFIDGFEAIAEKKNPNCTFHQIAFRAKIYGLLVNAENLNIYLVTKQ